MPELSREEILSWLREEDPLRLEQLWQRADAVRREYVGDEVRLRGLVEIGNHCRRKCTYCGISSCNSELRRYRMTAAEIFDSASQAVGFGYGTIVMQAGEDPGINAEWLADVIRRIKRETELAVTLSLGERTEEELALWREAGADRYLLRFETSDRALYELIHPPLPGKRSDRFAILEQLRSLGYETGSGVMIGIPGQSFASLADDIARFAEIDLDMVGVGPYLAHPNTPLARGEIAVPEAGSKQVPATELMAYKVVALTRLCCPEANIPSTTALASLNQEQGRELGLMRGANVIMPNLTPVEYRSLYEIYPAKACIAEGLVDFHDSLMRRIASIGRVPGTGQGGRRRHRG